MAAINDFTTGWYANLEDLVEELEDSGFSVIEANREVVTVEGGENEDGEDVQYILWLGGTERTIVVVSIETETI